MSFKKAFLVSWICYFPASQICNEFNLGIFFVSYGLDTTSTLEHVADTFRFYFFDPKHSRPAEIPLFLRVSWCSLFFIRDLSEIFLDAHVGTCSCFRDARGKFHDGRLKRPRKRWNSIAGHQEWKADVRFWNNFLNVFFVFNETGKGYGTQFERHRLEIVFVIESSAWLCLSCRWDQFLLCPRLTHSWCFSGVSTTTTTTTGSYILFIWQAVTFDNNNNIDGTSLCCVLDWGSNIFFIWKEAGFVKNNNSSCIDTLLYLSDKQLPIET